MRTKTKYLLAIVIFIILGSTIFKSITPNKIDKEIYFLNTSAYVSGYIGDEINIPLTFFYDAKKPTDKIISNVQLLSGNFVSLKGWEVKDGSKFKGYQLNNISINLKIEKEGKNELEGIKILLYDGGEKIYKFDKFIMLGINKPKSDNYLNVASEETYLSQNDRTSFDVKNNSDKTIVLDDFGLVSDNAKIKQFKLQMNDNIFDKIKDVNVLPSNIFKITIETDPGDNSDIYFIKPYIDYRIDGKKFTDCITFGTIHGIPIADEKLLNIYNRLIKNKNY
ncbi:hypothetical protein [Desulfosporosinus shakirovi]|uniref:hypothetical protein n=1 Tax=Desulfosporosinus shakirovi TaxID=2885154 RepID=UPI001E4D7896|nr:hypothetical protein [Desulfosporosinus sp. SRJS8]MCB8817580.1 hypothetical protein [Desulfosporosinus sp. SRJS8]